MKKQVNSNIGGSCREGNLQTSPDRPQRSPARASGKNAVLNIGATRVRQQRAVQEAGVEQLRSHNWERRLQQPENIPSTVSTSIDLIAEQKKLVEFLLQVKY